MDGSELRRPAQRSEGADAIADERAYLQHRVLVYTRALFWVITILGVLMVAIFSAIEPPYEDFWSNPRTFTTFAVPPLMLGAAWRFVTRGPKRADVLRAVEVAVTWALCAVLITAPLSQPADQISPASGTTGVIHLAVVASCFLVIRAAAVPSTPMTTLLVTTASLAPIIPLAYFRWNSPFTLGGLDVSGSGVLTFSMVVLFVVSAATIVTRIVHRLETVARDAMRLGQYTVEEQIGQGGMGVVYKATHALLRRPTAIKLLAPDRTGEDNLARFEREVVLTSQLTHPNTVAIYDYGHTPDGVFYYAMELLDGIDLQRLVDDHGPLPPNRAVHILQQVCGALEEAHGIGLIHRDIKPANIILCKRGGKHDVAKVVDFGLVKRLNPNTGDPAASDVSVLTGTPRYMAPEAILSPDKVDARSDLYSLGIVAYFLLCGEVPFAGASIVEVCSQQLNDEPKAPSARADQPIGADLDAVILECLQKDAQARPADAAALGSALAACAGAWTQEEAGAWWDSHDVAPPRAPAAAATTIRVAL